jgi:hypothetical protein
MRWSPLSSTPCALGEERTERTNLILLLRPSKVAMSVGLVLASVSAA